MKREKGGKAQHWRNCELKKRKREKGRNERDELSESNKLLEVGTRNSSVYFLLWGNGNKLETSADQTYPY